jgi:fatty acid/phospholipid biosynthesis enzyme
LFSGVYERKREKIVTCYKTIETTELIFKHSRFSRRSLRIAIAIVPAGDADESVESPAVGTI